MAASRPPEEEKEKQRREDEARKQARAEAFYNAWRKQNQVAKWRVLGSEDALDLDTLAEATVTRGYGPNDPMEKMPTGFLRRVDAEKDDYSDLYSDGKSLTSYDRGNIVIKAGNIAADIKNQQDCWAKHGVGAIVINNKRPNTNVLDGIMQRLEAMQGEHPPRAIHLGQDIIAFIHKPKDFNNKHGMKNGQVSPKWEKLLKLAAESQDRHQKYVDSKVSKVEAKSEAKEYQEMADKFNDTDKCPPAPVGDGATLDYVEKTLQKDAPIIPHDTKTKLDNITPEIDKLEKRAEDLAKARKQLIDQAEKFDEKLKDPKITFAEADAIRIKLEKEAPQRAALLSAMDKEEKQIDGLRQAWQQELSKAGYPGSVARPLAEGVDLPRIDKLRDKLSGIENSVGPASGATSVADMRAKFNDLKDVADLKASELQKGPPVARKPR